ncbi:uncharacterized protein LOC144031711 [Festucalex cinctus]
MDAESDNTVNGCDIPEDSEPSGGYDDDEDEELSALLIVRQGLIVFWMMRARQLKQKEKGQATGRRRRRWRKMREMMSEARASQEKVSHGPAAWRFPGYSESTTDDHKGES